MDKTYAVSQVAQEIVRRNAQDERRLDLTFARLGDILIEIAAQSEIHSADNKRFRITIVGPRKQ